MEGRRIPGEGIEHERDYIEERLEDAGDVDELTRAAERLRDEERDLEQLEGRPRAGDAQGDTTTLEAESNLGGDRMQTRRGAELGATSASQVDPQQQPPEAEARARTVDRIREGLTP